MRSTLVRRSPYLRNLLWVVAVAATSLFVPHPRAAAGLGSSYADPAPVLPLDPDAGDSQVNFDRLIAEATALMMGLQKKDLNNRCFVKIQLICL